MASEALLRYVDLTRRWLRLRDEANEDEQDAHLEEMDDAWEALTEEEQKFVNEKGPGP